MSNKTFGEKRKENARSIRVMLDRFVGLAKEVAPLLCAGKATNGRLVQLKMNDFSLTCGYTQKLSKELFAHANQGFRLSLQCHGITFPSSSKGWTMKEICIDVTYPYPRLQEVFDGVDDLPVVLENDEVVNENGEEANTEPVQQPAVPVEFPGLVMVHHMDDNQILIKNKNGKTRHYVRLPKAGQIQTWDNFLHALPCKRMATILQLVAGDTRNGVILMTRLLYTMNKEAFLEGLHECGTSVLKKLNPIETLAFQADCGLTTATRINSCAAYYVGHRQRSCQSDPTICR